MKRLLIRWLVAGIAVAAAAWIVPGITVDGSRGVATVIGMAFVLGLVNALIRPILRLLSLPLIAMTLGLFLLVINAALFALASWLLPNFSVDGFISALEGSIIVSVVSWLVSFIIPGAKKKRSDRLAELGRKAVYIAGVAESPLGEVWDQTENSMVALAAREALTEAGMTLKDVDGVFVNYMGDEGSVQVGEYLGIQPRYADSTDMGGGSFEVFVHHAMQAIANGRCEVALVAYASRQRTRRNRRMQIDSDDGYSIASQFEVPHGLPAPIGHFALLAARHMHQFGTTSEQLAEVAVAARKWARLNPKAWSRDPLTIEDVLASRMISSPFHRHDVCLVTDGGGAVVVTNAARAREAVKKPIRVIGAGESHVQWHISQIPDMTITPAAASGRDAFGMAGITPAEVDILEPYDAFTINPIMALEDLGFCAKGEGGAFVEGGRLAPGGDLPALTNGGGLSYCHPGAYGLFLLIEAVRQLRGEAGERQVPDPKIAVAHGIGGLASCAATVVLARD